MRMYDIIQKKRDGGELTKEEISFFVKGYTNGEIPDYQASALMMAIYFNKMNYNETLELTMEMAKSGDNMDLSGIEGVKVDKHSTGGVGDKTTLVVAPLVAAAGAPVAKMSGRGLGHTGGTIDKLEAFDGFNVGMSMEKFTSSVNGIGIAISAQTGNLAPADKKLYALRDVTATVENISLIAGSIMSKKLASGADAIVLDVKSGSGAFMKDDKGAFELAQEMVSIGLGAGRDMVALITDMDQPLGKAVGNSLEVIEAIDTLNGNGPKDLEDICLHLGAHMLLLSKKVGTIDEGLQRLRGVMESGEGIEKLKELVKNQGGDPSYVDDTSKFKKADIVKEVLSEQEGYVYSIKTDEIGRASLVLGAGRENKESEIDLSVGLIVEKKRGDYVRKGDVLAVVHSSSAEKFEEASRIIRAAYSLSEVRPADEKLIKGIVDKDGTRHI